MTASLGQTVDVDLQLPGLFCRAGGLAWQWGAGGHHRPVLGPDGRQVRGIDLHVGFAGEQIHNCSAVVLGADGQTGVVQVWDTDGVLGVGPSKRYTQRGQVRLWLK